VKILHRLRPRVVLLKDFYTFDVETGTRREDGSIKWGFPGRPETFIFGVIYGFNHTRVIHNLTEWIQAFLDPRYKNKIFFAHNAPYDLNTTYGNIFHMDPHAIFSGTKFISATNGNVKFADSMNVFGRVKLAKIGEMLGITKPGLGDENMISPNGVTADEINRCVTDCIITYEGLIQIFQGAGDIKITGPSLAMSYFRRFHQPYNIEYNENVLHFFDSYYGGRTEAFKIGATNASVIDVNSMYPFVMKNAVFPNPKFLKTETARPGHIIKPSYFINQILPYYEGLIYCTVNHKATAYGFLPYKTDNVKGKAKLLFPIGRFKGCWNLPEIRFALEQGAIEIESISRIVYAERMPTIFESFVDTLFEQKLTARHDFEIARVKHLLTDLYGKFAQKMDEDTIYIDDVEKQYEEIRAYQIEGKFVKLIMYNSERLDAMLVTKTAKGYQIPHQIPSIASYITSLARVHLLKQLIALHSRKVVYCDTDSVFFENAFGIESEFNLGGWKLEPKIVSEIRGLKNYSYYNEKKIFKNRIKGLPPTAVQNALGVWEYENLLNTKEALRRGLKAGTIMQRTKIISGKYDKRLVLENGDTKPIEIYEN